MQVLIRVIDTNNHRPQFSEKFYEVNVAEDQPPGTEVLQISATDRDEKNKLTFTLLSSTDPFSLRKFRLDPGTGTLYTAERLDHETMHRHILTVMVRPLHLNPRAFNLEMTSFVVKRKQRIIKIRLFTGSVLFRTGTICCWNELCLPGSHSPPPSLSLLRSAGS